MADELKTDEQWIITNPTGASGRMLKHQWAREHDGMLYKSRLFKSDNDFIPSLRLAERK